MPTRTLNIPTTTLPAGQTTLGPLNVGNNSQASIVTDRTLPGGLNSLTAASTVTVEIQTAPTSGIFAPLCGATWVGGIYTSARGGQLNSDNLVTGDADNARQVRVIVTVAGPAPVVLAGTVTAV